MNKQSRLGNIGDCFDTDVSYAKAAHLVNDSVFNIPMRVVKSSGLRWYPQPPTHTHTHTLRQSGGNFQAITLSAISSNDIGYFL